MSVAPLADLRVLDLSRGGGARACARLLAQLGADVEPHIVAGAAPLKQGARRHDVTLLDLQPAEARTLNLTPDRLVALGQVAVWVTPFGLDGSDAERVAAGSILGGVSPEIADGLTGAHAAVAALGALRWARSHYGGVLVEVAAVEVVASCLGESLPRAACPRRVLNAVNQGVDPTPAALQCSDGYVGIAAPTTVDRELLAAMTGVEAIRAETADLGRLLGPWLQARTRAEVFHQAQLWRLPAVPVLKPSEVRCDEQSLARGAWGDDFEVAAAPRSPFRFSSVPGHARRAPRPSPLPLSDLRVLDLGMIWAGPHAGRLLAGLGARVIKVEAPARPDGTRSADGRGCAGAYADLNRGKMSLVVDLMRPAGRDLFLGLVAGADIVLENFSPRVMPNFGLEYSVLADVNAGLVMLSLPAFGSDGPWGTYVAYGGGLELATGLAVWGADGRPQAAPIAYLDYLAGTYGAAGVLAALLARDRNGQGVHLEVAQREVACQVMPVVPHRRPTFAVNSTQVASDPHLATRGLFVRSDPRGHLCHHYARLPWRLHGVPDRPERDAPAFGGETRSILRQRLRLEDDAIDRLARDRVVTLSQRPGEGLLR